MARLEGKILQMFNCTFKGIVLLNSICLSHENDCVSWDLFGLNGSIHID